MTQQPQQLKFGDRVRRKSDGATGVVIHQQFQSVWVVFEGSTTSDADYADEFELIPHPDNSRLDFIEKVINIDGMVKRKMGEGWTLVVEHELSEPKPLLRDAIDAAMKETN